MAKNAYKYILIIFYLPLITSTNLLDILDKKIYINLASHINYRLAEDLSAFGDDMFTFYNYQHYLLENKYVGYSILEKYDDQYRIKIGSHYICSVNEHLTPCKSNDFYWSIRFNIHGYIIYNNNRCITIDKKLTLKKCGEPIKQEFVFELRPLIFDCLDSITSLIEKSYTDDQEKNKKILDDAIKLHGLDLDDHTVAAVTAEIQNKKDVKKFIENIVPEAIGKKKTTNVIEALHEHTWDWSWFNFALNWLTNLFCPQD